MSRRRDGGKANPIVVVAVVAAVAAAAAVATVVLTHRAEQPPSSLPDLPLLADAPDPGLRGTVAYFSTTSGCVRVVAASGADSRDVLCPDDAAGLAGPALAFTDDGRLAVTALSGDLVPVWQRIVDPVSGAVEEVAAAGLPATLEDALGEPPAPAGLGLRVDTEVGSLGIVVYGSGAPRFVYQEYGPPVYLLAYDPIWSPDGEWFLIDEGRLVVVTIRNPATARILATDQGSFGADLPDRTPLAAVTGDDLLAGD